MILLVFFLACCSVYNLIIPRFCKVYYHWFSRGQFFSRYIVEFWKQFVLKHQSLNCNILFSYDRRYPYLSPKKPGLAGLYLQVYHGHDMVLTSMNIINKKKKL